MTPVKEKTGPYLTCPSCGALLRITGTEEVQAKSDVNIKDVLAIFSPATRPKLDVKIEGKMAIIEWRGKFDRKKWNKAAGEVRGYGGRWIKGHFILPIAGLVGDK